MTNGLETDGPPEETEAEEPDVETPESGEAAQAPKRARRRALRVAKAEELGNWSFIEAHPPGGESEVILRGPRIGTQEGDIEVIGSILARLGKFVRELGGGETRMRQLAFAQSAHVLLVPGAEEVARAEQELERASELRRQNQPNVEQLRRAVTDIQIGLALAADLLASDPEDTPREAVRYGVSVAVALKSLATGAATNDVTVVVPALQRPTAVTLTPARASLVSEALREVDEPRIFEIDVYGTLSMADAIHNGFALRLDPAGERPQVLKGKRLVSGTYPPRVSDVIRERALWGKSVRATVRVEQDAVVSNSQIRPPTFTLLDAEERP